MEVKTFWVRTGQPSSWITTDPLYVGHGGQMGDKTPHTKSTLDLWDLQWIYSHLMHLRKFHKCFSKTPKIINQTPKIFPSSINILVCEIGFLGNKKLGSLTLSTTQCVSENRSQIASENKAADSTLFYLYPTHRVTQWGAVSLVSQSRCGCRFPITIMHQHWARKTSICHCFAAEQFVLRPTVLSVSISWEEVADYVMKETSN